MPQPAGREAHIEVLGRSACLDLIATAHVGRVVVSLSSLPAVLPVPMILDGDAVVFAVPHGSDFERAVSGAVVAVEADVLDRLAGWSVVVTGKAVPIPEGAVAPDGAWPLGSVLFRLPTEFISGRRLANPAIHVGGSVPVAMAAAVNRQAAAGRGLGYGVGAESIRPGECIRLLASEEVGRLAVVVDAQPLMFPVNYTLDGDTIVFRTAAGAKLDAISRSLATFEVDRWSPADRSGWAVIVEGFAVEVTEDNAAPLRERMARLPLFPWVPGERPHLVRIMPVSVSGSRWRAGVSPAGG